MCVFDSNSEEKEETRNDEALSTQVYGALQSLRMTLVNEGGGNLLSYHIMPKRSSAESHRELPKIIEELLEVNGIGKTKAKKYGARILVAVAKVVQECQLSNGEPSMQEIEGSSGPLPKRQRVPDGDDWKTKDDIPLDAMDDDFMDDSSVPMRSPKRYKPPKP